MNRANSTAGKSCSHTESSLRIIYNLQFEESTFWLFYSFISLLLFNKNNTWHPTCSIVQTTCFNRPAKFLILLKHWGYDNFELNWFHGLSKSPAIPFPRWAPTHFASIFRNALDLFTLSLPLARHVLHGVWSCETSTKHPRLARGNFIPILKITRDELPME